MSQILRSTPATLELLVYQAGDLTDLDALPTLAITDANGNSVSSGSVTKPSATTGTYRSVLQSQSDLTTLAAVWSGDLSSEPVSFKRGYEIVGNLLFIEAQARAKTITGQQTPLSDNIAYPDSDIARMRTLITDQFEHRTGRAWTRRYSRVELVGNGGPVIDLWDGHARDSRGDQVGGPGRYRHIAKIIGATVDAVAVSAADLAIDGRRIIHKTGVWVVGSISDPFNVVVEYEYGPDPVPFEANENGLLMALANLVPSDVSAYAQTFAGEDGTITFGPNGLAWPTKVWEWLKHSKPVLIA